MDELGDNAAVVGCDFMGNQVLVCLDSHSIERSERN